MRQLLKNQVLDALRDSLRDLENLKLVSADEPEVALLKQQLQSKIAQIENDGDGDERYREMAA